MAKTNWQDPQTSEIRSTHISGLMDAVGKLEESIGMDTVAEENIPLTEVYISAEDRYRIFQAPAGKRNWLASPAPVIKKNGVVIESDYVIDYGGGAIALSVNDTEENTYTADATYVTPLNTSFKSHLAEVATHLINPAGDGVTNDRTVLATAVSAAKASKMKTLDLGANKTYFIDGATIDVSGLRIIGNNIKIKGNGQKIFSASGTIGTYTALNANADRGAYSIDSALASSLSVGDLVKITSNADFSAADAGRKQGEMHIVQAISGTVITFHDPLFDSYTTANGAKVAKVTPVTIEITSGITIENKGTAATEFGIDIKLAMRPIIKCVFNKCAYTSLNLEDCYAPISDVLINDSIESGTGYGVCLSNATMYAKTTGTILWCRHPVAHGGNGDGGVAWESHVTVNAGCDKDNATTACFDAHPSTGSVYWEDCVANGGVAGVKLHARYNYVNNLRGKTARTGSTLLIVNNIANLSVDTIDIKNANGDGYSWAFENYMPVTNLNIDGLGTNLSAIYIRANVTAWDIRNIKSKKTGINIAATITIPSELKLSNSDFLWTDLAGTAYGLYNMNANLKRIVLANCSQVRMSALIRTDTDLDSIELYGCQSVEPYSSHIYAGTKTVARLVIIGGVYRDNQQGDSTHGCILKGNATIATIQGITTAGNNLDYIIYGTVGTLMHSGNSFHALTAIVGGSTPLQVLGGSLGHARVLAGTGTPEAVVTAPIGTLYLRDNGGANTTLYIKESGTGNTGWVAK